MQETEEAIQKEGDTVMQPVVMLIDLGVFMFAVIGGISLLLHYYTLNGIRVTQ